MVYELFSVVEFDEFYYFGQQWDGVDGIYDSRGELQCNKCIFGIDYYSVFVFSLVLLLLNYISKYVDYMILLV